MHKYQSSPMPGIPGEPSHAQNLLRHLAIQAREFDGESEVLVAKLSALQRNPDGSIVTRNADGLITTIVYLTGNVVHLNYDDQGHIVQFTDLENYVYRLENNRFQQYYSDSDATTGKYLFENEADVDYDGNFTLFNPNASYMIAKTDGSVIEADSAGNITRVNYSDGRIHEIEYDTAGAVMRIVDLQSGETLNVDADTQVKIDALGVISVIKYGVGYVWQTTGECDTQSL